MKIKCKIRKTRWKKAVLYAARESTNLPSFRKKGISKKLKKKKIKIYIIYIYYISQKKKKNATMKV